MINLLFIILGICLITQGHPIWGILLILFGFPTIKYKHVDDGKHNVHIVLKIGDDEDE